MSIGATLLNKLGQSTVRQALGGATPELRANAVQSLGRELRAIELTEQERRFATKIMDRICADVSDLVRRALSVTLQNSPNLPIGVARKLIDDIDSIAAPILSNSPVLSENDLIAALKSGAAAKIKAVAQRRTLSSHITSAIISHGDSLAVATLAANDGAIISPQTAAYMAAHYADDDLIREAALSRHDFPPAVMAKLIRHGARKVGAQIKATRFVSDGQAKDISDRTAERANLMATTSDWSQKSIRLFIEELNVQGALTDRFLARLAACGDMMTLQEAFACRSDQTSEKIALMMFDGGPLGVRAVCLQARLRGHYVTVIECALMVHADLCLRAGDLSRDRFRRTMLERVLSSTNIGDTDFAQELMDILDASSGPRAV